MCFHSEFLLIEVQKSRICARIWFGRSPHWEDRWEWAWVFRNPETLNLSILLTIIIFSIRIMVPWLTVVDKNSIHQKYMISKKLVSMQKLTHTESTIYYVQCLIQTYSTHIMYTMVIHICYHSHFCWQKYTNIVNWPASSTRSSENPEFCFFNRTVLRAHRSVGNERVFRNRETLNLSILLTINIISFWIILPWWTVVDKNQNFVKIHVQANSIDIYSCTPEYARESSEDALEAKFHEFQLSLSHK